MLGEISGEMSKLEIRGMEAGQSLSNMQVARRAPAKDLLRAQPFEARQRRIDHALALAQLPFPLRLNDSAARPRPADDFVVRAKRVEHVHRIEEQVRCPQRVASQVEDDFRLTATPRIEYPRKLGRQQLHSGHQPDRPRHLAEELRCARARTRIHRVSQHQHLARVDTLWARRDAFAASVARMCEGRRSTIKRGAVRKEINYAARYGFEVGLCEPGIQDNGHISTHLPHAVQAPSTLAFSASK